MRIIFFQAHVTKIKTQKKNLRPSRCGDITLFRTFSRKRSTIHSCYLFLCFRPLQDPHFPHSHPTACHGEGKCVSFWHGCLPGTWMINEVSVAKIQISEHVLCGSHSAGAMTDVTAFYPHLAWASVIPRLDMRSAWLQALCFPSLNWMFHSQRCISSLVGLFKVIL